MAPRDIPIVQSTFGEFLGDVGKTALHYKLESALQKQRFEHEQTKMLMEKDLAREDFDHTNEINPEFAKGEFPLNTPTNMGEAKIATANKSIFSKAQGLKDALNAKYGVGKPGWTTVGQMKKTFGYDIPGEDSDPISPLEARMWMDRFHSDAPTAQTKNDYVSIINGKGLIDRFEDLRNGAVREGQTGMLKGRWASLANAVSGGEMYPELKAYMSFRASNLSQIAKMSGEGSRLTEGDIQRVAEGIPDATIRGKLKVLGIAGAENLPPEQLAHAMFDSFRKFGDLRVANMEKIYPQLKRDRMALININPEEFSKEETRKQPSNLPPGDDGAPTKYDNWTPAQQHQHALDIQMSQDKIKEEQRKQIEKSRKP